jgi:hypothetical protein
MAKLRTQQTTLGSPNGLTGRPSQGGGYQLQPGQVMMGNQPSVPTATPGSYITQTQQTPGQAPVVSQGSAPWTPPGVPPPATTGWGQYTPEGFDANKMSSGHSTPKYQIGQALSNFDYSQGITEDVLNALRGLGIGDVRQLSKDKVEFYGNVDPRFEGKTTIDLLRGASGPGGPQAWQYGLDDGPAAQVASQAPAFQMPQLNLGGGGGGSRASSSASSSVDPFGGSGVRLADGSWVPNDHPDAAGAKWAGGGGGGTSSSRPFMGDDVRGKIMELLNTGGQFNTNLLNSRAETLREQLEGTRNIESQTLDAVLADRGLTGGANIQARMNQGERLNQQHATQLRQLVSDESQMASDRMMQALTTGAGMTIEEANQAVDWFNAQANRDVGMGQVANAARGNEIDQLLGLGNLGLGQATLSSNYALGQGRLGLDAQLGMGGLQNDWLSTMAQIMGLQANQTPAG